MLVGSPLNLGVVLVLLGQTQNREDAPGERHQGFVYGRRGEWGWEQTGDVPWVLAGLITSLIAPSNSWAKCWTWET